MWKQQRELFAEVADNDSNNQNNNQGKEDSLMDLNVPIGGADDSSFDIQAVDINDKIAEGINKENQEPNNAKNINKMQQRKMANKGAKQSKKSQKQQTNHP